MKIPHILKPSKKKIIIFIVIVLLALLGFYLFSPKKGAVVEFIQVKRADIAETVSASGSLDGKDTANLKFKISGKIVSLPFKTGDKVIKGQTIASLDTQDLSITLQQAQNTYRDKQATATKIEDDVKDHSSDESFTLQATRTTAQAARDSAYDAVKAAQRDFQDAVISSPISGVVTQSNVISGQIVSPADLIAQVVDPSIVYFDADFDEADSGKIMMGQTAQITLDAYPNQTFTGIVDRIIPQTKTTSTGATVVTVKIKLDQSPPQFIVGLSGQSSIVVNEEKAVLTIPQDALLNDTTVVIKDPASAKDVYKTVSVQTGISSDTDIEIKSGLLENQTIVKNPSVVKLGK